MEGDEDFINIEQDEKDSWNFPGQGGKILRYDI